MFWIGRVGNKASNAMYSSTDYQHIALRQALKRLKLQRRKKRWYCGGGRKTWHKHHLVLLPCLQLQESYLSSEVHLKQPKRVELLDASPAFSSQPCIPIPSVANVWPWHELFHPVRPAKTQDTLLPKTASSSAISAILYSAFVKDLQCQGGHSAGQAHLGAHSQFSSQQLQTL